jgi:Domain of unknown function (DUF5642)
VVTRCVRLLTLSGAMALCVAACATTPDAGPAAPTTSSTANRAVKVNPANITRVRGELPPGYEVADVPGPASPVRLWGFGPDWTADPPQCAALADPVGDGAGVQGLSGSGPGGIVYAVVTGSPPASLNLDPGVLAECGQWTVTSGRTTATVNLIDPPHIDGVATVGMATDAKTTVEGGIETDSRARTFTAYLDGYVAFVAVVTDPGSPSPALGADFPAALLVKTVSALRS